jgi:hypothetical protein
MAMPTECGLSLAETVRPFFYAVEFFAGERLAIKGEVEKSVGLAVMGVLPVVVDVLMTFLAALGDAVLAREFV